MMREIDRLRLEKLPATKIAMENVLKGSPNEGVGISELYKTLELQGFSESVIQTTFLHLAQINVVDLTGDRKIVLNSPKQ